MALLVGAGSPQRVLAEGADGSSEADEAGRRAFKIAEAHYANGEFAEAARRFAEAYSFTPRPTLLYNLYLAYRDAQDLERARDVLAAYLAQAPRDSSTPLLRSRLRELTDRYGAPRPFDAQTAARAAATASPPSKPAGSPASDSSGAASTPNAPPSGEAGTPSTQAASNSAAAATTDGKKPSPAAGIVVLGAGGALLVTGAVTGVLTLTTKAQLAGRCDAQYVCDVSLEPIAQRARTFALVTDITLGAGLAAAIVGTVLLFTLRSPSEEPRPDAPVASWGCGPTGCIATVRGVF